MSKARRPPAVHAILEHPVVSRLIGSYGRELTLTAVREVLKEERQSLRSGGGLLDAESLCERIAQRLATWCADRPRTVVNATGVILHTNLGRAPVSEAAARAMKRAAAGYCDLEYDLSTGERSSRQRPAEEVLCRLTGAEAGLVVNNNAAATLLAVTALAAGKEVIVSRGELVEIGGSYRLPSILQVGGGQLIEVGTSNRTYISDYAAAICERTGLILRVHQSNYRIVGYTCRPDLRELAELARAHSVPLLDDLGSGALLDTRQLGLSYEPVVMDSLAAGADVVTFSGDKLVGGPQAGVVVGRRELVSRMRQHPLARAVRPGKDILAGLHATLLHYLRGEALREVPVWRMIAASPEALADRAAEWQRAIGKGAVVSRLVPGESTVGGGSLPGERLPTTLLVFEVENAERMVHLLRTADPPVIARIHDEKVVLDPRTVLPGEDAAVTDALRRAIACL